MLRAFAVLVLALSFVAAASHPARACSKRHQTLFELFELATNVAVVKVRAVTPSRNKRNRLPAGPVELGVIRSLKGDPKRKTLVAQETNTSCNVGFKVGRTALVFVGKDGWPSGGYEGYLTDFKDLEPTLVKWAAASDDAARLALLVDTIATGTQPQLVTDAAFYLADEPALIVAIDATQHATLVDALKTAPNYSQLPLVLARLRDPAVATERSVAKLMAVTKFETVTDTGALADAIKADKGESNPERIAAFERCERIHKKKLYGLTSYIGGVSVEWWLHLAEACRTGTRPTL